MKILYFSGMPLPIENILKGKTKVEGFPAYYYPMYKLIKKGHDVKFIFASNYPGPYNVKVDWFDPNNIIANLSMVYSEKKGLYRIFRGMLRVKQLLFHLWKATSKEKFDFIYAHSSMAAIAQIIGMIRGIPVGVRWYGDSNFCYADIKKIGKHRAALKHPLNWLNYKLKYEFFLTTDDHSYGDKVYEAWKVKNPSGKFYFWKTGIEMKSIDECSTDIPIPDEKYIFFGGRFARWKRQDRVIETLKELHLQNIKLHLYFAGQTEGGASSIEYIKELKDLISKYNLDEYVHFLGGVSQDTLRVFAYNSIATLIMHDIANIGNVFYETMSVGAVLVVTDDGSVRQFIKNSENGFIVDDSKDAANKIIYLLSNSEKVESIKQSAISTSKLKFLSADERFDNEVTLIEGVMSK